MRPSVIITAILATGALATPVIDRRAIKIENVVVTTTEYVNAGNAAAVKVAPTTPAAVNVNAAAYPSPHAHHHHQAQPVKAPAAVAPAPEQSSPSAPYVAPPAPEPTLTTKAQAVAPPPATSAAPSPQTTVAPSPVKSSAQPVNNDNLPTTAVANLDSGSEIYKGLSAQHHNVHRQNHSVPALTWNDTLASYAETIAKSCVYAHDR